MPAGVPSPLNTYLAHLEKGELAYQYSPEAGKAVFYPRLLCPFTGSRALEWRISKGLGTVHATTVVYPAESAGRLHGRLPIRQPLRVGPAKRARRCCLVGLTSRCFGRVETQR